VELCDWLNGPCGGSGLEWSINDGETWSPFTGPSDDHTTLNQTDIGNGTLIPLTVPSPSNGFYIYIEASFPRYEGDCACLDSPAINASATPGFTWWRHLYGKHITSLNVYASTDYNASDPARADAASFVSLFNASEATGDRWVWSHLCLSDFNITGDTVLRLEACVGDGFQGDIAVDDVHFGECLVYPPPSPPPPPSPVPPPSPPPPSPPPCERPSEFVLIEDGGICDQSDPTVYGVCDPCGTESRGPLDCVCVSSFIRRKRRGHHLHAAAETKRELLFGGVPGGDDFCYCQEVGA